MIVRINPLMIPARFQPNLLGKLVIYNLYLNLGVIGLRSLENYISEDNVSAATHG